MLGKRCRPTFQQIYFINYLPKRPQVNVLHFTRFCYFNPVTPSILLINVLQADELETEADARYSLFRLYQNGSEKNDFALAWDRYQLEVSVYRIFAFKKNYINQLRFYALIYSRILLDANVAFRIIRVFLFLKQTIRMI